MSVRNSPKASAKIAPASSPELTDASVTGSPVTGDICGPVRLQVDGFRPTYTEVLFVDMEENAAEPLLGYIPLEQCGAAVDMLGHRLLQAARIDLKRAA